MRVEFNNQQIYIRVRALSIQEKKSVEKIIIHVLQTIKEGTTAEIITEVSKTSPECIDKILSTLISLSKEGLIKKVISKTKKGFIWVLE